MEQEVAREPVGDNSEQKAKTLDKNKMSLTVWECNNLVAIISSQSPRGSGIKDIRLIKSVRDKINAAIPERPKKPDPKEFIADAKKATPEEQAEWLKVNAAWTAEIQEYAKKELILSLGDIARTIIISKLKGFNGYPEDEDTTNKFIALFDKFGITE